MRAAYYESNGPAREVLHLADVETPQTGSHTAVEITDLKFNQGLKDDLFTQRQLERGGR